MIRIITYLVISILGITVSLGQVKSEQILLKNENISLTGKLTYTQKDSHYLKAAFTLTKKGIETIVNFVNQ
ncbi:hypothetical protein BTO04_14600 [Polaribacter sp. SA4-10]|uniref:hypothetical protein n=1 Tax=Polaribacter sp. SA4-10 TaxID=754397 RepID=UPI000B3C9E0D|nr:hypothetical protein [Polaribacter sp. SA4-10]ARV07852.1 hypothetical protein BTO04_14600 [Polaribacter sp. SA4-10]